jgi:hypothetical protein
MCEGRSNKQIAQELPVALDTVSKYVTGVMSKVIEPGEPHYREKFDMSR